MDYLKVVKDEFIMLFSNLKDFSLTRIILKSLHGKKVFFHSTLIFMLLLMRKIS